MSKPIIIRPSQATDAQQLVDIDNSGIWTPANAPVELSGNTAAEFAMQNPPGSHLVADWGGTLCGYIGFRSPTPLASNQHVSQLDIAVLPAYQRLGIGRKLIEAAKPYCAAQGKRKLSLRVLASNCSAIAFYKSCGFVEQGRLVDEFCIDGQYIDDVWMYIPI